MELNEAIKLWEENNISRCEMEFSCGGDNMSDTNFTFYNTKGDVVECDDELYTYFDNMVYKHVNFYINSDGHYIGEHGTVDITLNEEDENKCFDYVKQSTSEWSESDTQTFYISISDAEKKLIEEKLEGFSVEDGVSNIEYVGDLILSDEETETLELLMNRVEEEAEDYSFKDEDGYVKESDGEWYNAEYEKIEENSIKIQITRSFYVEKED
jgi:hypothetical protein